MHTVMYECSRVRTNYGIFLVFCAIPLEISKWVVWKCLPMFPTCLLVFLQLAKECAAQYWICVAEHVSIPVLFLRTGMPTALYVDSHFTFFLDESIRALELTFSKGVFYWKKLIFLKPGSTEWYIGKDEIQKGKAEMRFRLDILGKIFLRSVKHQDRLLSEIV